MTLFKHRIFCASDINFKETHDLNKARIKSNIHDFFHFGIFPRLVNVSTKDTAPSIDEIRKYMPDADEKGIVHKEVVNKQLYKL